MFIITSERFNKLARKYGKSPFLATHKEIEKILGMKIKVVDNKEDA